MPRENRDVETIMHIARKITEHRERIGLSQGHFGDMLGLGRTTIVHMEAGKCRLTADRIWAVCCVLNIEPNELLPPIVPVKYERKKVQVEKYVYVKQMVEEEELVYSNLPFPKANS